MINKRKLVLIGTGFVGMSMAYSLVCEGTSSGVTELVLIDIQKEKALGEVMDLAHGLPCSRSNIKIKFGDYNDCSDADLIVITAGLNQKPNQSRLELTMQNTIIIKNITKKIKQSAFDGIILVATNPVDIMTMVVKEISGFSPNKIIGSGTVLDTARLRFLLGEYLNISSKNVHAYIMGEHGDSSFPLWNHSYIGCKKLTDIVSDKSILNNIHLEVKNAAYEIIERKKATYYGIGLALSKIVRTIMNDTNEILTVSTYLNNKYGQQDIYLGAPVVLNSSGVKELLELDLSSEEQLKLDKSSKIIKENFNSIRSTLTK